MAELKEKYHRIEERCRRRNARGPALAELSFAVTRVEGARKTFEDTLCPKRLAQHELKTVDREVADLRKRLANAEGRTASTRDKLRRISEVWDRCRAEGEALYQKYEAL